MSNEVSVYYLNHSGFLYNIVHVRFSEKKGYGILLLHHREYKISREIVDELYNKKIFDKIIIIKNAEPNINIDDEQQIKAIITEYYNNIFQKNDIDVNLITSIYIARDGQETLSLYAFFNEQLINTIALIEMGSENPKERANGIKSYMINRNYSNTLINLYLKSGAYDYTLYTDIYSTKYRENYDDIIQSKWHIIDYDQKVPKLDLPSFNNNNLKNKTVIMCNSYTIFRKTLLSQENNNVIYDLLMDYYGSNDELFVLKLHPNTTNEMKKSIDKYCLLGEIPMDFISLNNETHIRKILTVASSGYKPLLDNKITSEVVIAGSEFLLFKDIIFEIDIVIDLILFLSNKHNKKYTIKQTISDNFFDKYLENKGIVNNDGYEIINLMFDYQMNDTLNVSGNTIIISNSRNVTSCINNNNLNNIIAINYSVTKTNNATNHDEFFDDILVCGNISEKIMNYTYKRELKNSGLVVKTNDIGYLKWSSKREPVNAFDDQKRTWLSNYYSKNMLSKYPEIDNWLFKIAANGVKWAIELYLFLSRIDCKCHTKALSLVYDNFALKKCRDYLVDKELDNYNSQTNQYFINLIITDYPDTIDKLIGMFKNRKITFDNIDEKTQKLIVSCNNSTALRYVIEYEISVKQYVIANNIIKIALKNIEDEYNFNALFELIWKCNDKIITETSICYLKSDLDKINVYTGWLGRAYRDGKGVDQNYNLAETWYKKAIEYDILWARKELFDIYWKRNNEELDHKMIKLITPLIKIEDGPAMGRLGRAYREGRGVNKDLKKAAKWMNKAANKGVPWAKKEYDELVLLSNNANSTIDGN